MSLALRSLHSEIIFLKKCEIYLVPIHQQFGQLPRHFLSMPVSEIF